jgi:hypothetical protein
MLADEGDKSVPPVPPKIFGVRPPVRTRGVFPQRAPGPSLALLRRIASGEQVGELSQRERDSLRDLLLLGAVDFTVEGALRLVSPELIRDGQIDRVCLRALIETKRGCTEALSLLEEDPSAAPIMVGEVLCKAYGAEWAPGTMLCTGKYLRAWARIAGVKTRTRPPHVTVDSESSSEPLLDFDAPDGTPHNFPST